MANKNITTMRNEATAKVFTELTTMLADGGFDPIQTDTSAVDVPVTLEDGTELYLTVKATLHKAEYDIEDAVAAYTEKVEKARERAEAKEKKARENAEKKAKREAEKAAKEKASESAGE